MAKKIVLGKRPKTFAPITVTFKLPEGGDGCMEITAKYFTRTEFGKLLDDLYTEARTKAEEKAKAEEAIPAGSAEAIEAIIGFSQERLQKLTRDQNADYLVKVLDGWNLDVELSRESLVQLADECPAAITALMAGVRAAALDGRLGNSD